MQTKTKNPTYRVVTLTGATLVDQDGRGYGPEIGRVVSRHRSQAAAERVADAHRRSCPCGHPVAVQRVG